MSDDSINIDDYFSPAAMAEREVVTDAVEPVTDKEPEALVDDAPVVEPVVDDTPEPEAETVDEPAVTDEWQTRYEEAQKLIGRQGQELGDLRKAFEQFQSEQNQPAPEPEPSSPFQQYAPTSPQELVELATDPENAEYAFQFAATQAPEYLPHVLAEVQLYDPASAERMRMEYYAYVAQQSAAPAHQAYEQQAAQAQTANAVNQFTQSVEGWDGIKDEVAKVIEEEPWLVGNGSDAEVQQGLRAAVRMVNQARQVATTHAQAQATQQSVEKRQAAAVETGTSGAAPVVTPTDESKQIHDAIFAQDNVRRDLGL